MKRILLGIALLCSTSVMYSQKCDFLKNEVDPITGEKNVITKFENINKKFTSRFWFAQALSKSINSEFGEIYLLSLKLTGGGQSLFIKKGDNLILKLNDDSIMKLPAFDNYTTDFKIISGAKVSSVIASYNPTIEQLQEIKDKGIKLIRMETSDSDYDSEVTPKDNKKIAQSIECVINE